MDAGFLIFGFVVIGLFLCGEGIACFGIFGVIFSWPLELVFHDSNDCYLNALAVSIYRVSLECVRFEAIYHSCCGCLLVFYLRICGDWFNSLWRRYNLFQDFWCNIFLAVGVGFS